ncbi:phospho-sugar mutase [Enterococcus sp. BWB1-3]|uniref:phospho-sugar mutase n=1 Tax=unclassified Enterococcus TaxID=2608891 RepID=UPI001922A1BC|nr:MULTISPECIES: phospho-sugar mutase [unclassified Enterococcus]MBL1229490.1 phospho-sugar mutase [Enterococcus sp. BWB1-3]MCB5955839.1 phospho-sugar mutase [Enterococcus sp. CWB-B31]
MEWQTKLQEWQKFQGLELDLKEQLAALSNPADLEERFYRYPEFGTGGMRGELGVGTNRINIYTIKRVALGLAKYILESDDHSAERGVVISYDNRHLSDLFARWTARILASKGIKVYLSDQLRPTPELSFLVRHYQAFAGVMITASHNPKQYNGFKVYGQDGGQITLETAARLTAILEEITNELSIQADLLTEYISEGLIEVFSSEADEWYLENLRLVTQNYEKVNMFGSQLKIVYTPLHGTGRILVSQAFKRIGFSNLKLVKEQEFPDPDFSTVKSPNPEDPDAFELALKQALKNQSDLVIATDPDADRLGVIVFKDGKPIYLNGNQIGTLLLDYLIKEKKRKGENLADYFLAKTIVTSDLGVKIAEANGIQVRNTLTGFKFIGEQIELSEEQNDKRFLFGYEESYGYLIEPFVRDKDAIQAAVLLAEAALDCQLSNSNLIDRLNMIYEEYGYYEEVLETKEFIRKNGINQMNQLVENLREKEFTSLADFELIVKEDYVSALKVDLVKGTQEKLLLPKSNVLRFVFKHNFWVCVRPSGTEPKFKIYYSVNAPTQEKANENMKALQAAFHQLVQI